MTLWYANSPNTVASGLVVCFVNENGRVLDTVRVTVAVDKSATATAAATAAAAAAAAAVDGKGACVAGPPAPPASIEEVTAPAKTSAPKPSTPHASARAVAAPVPPGWKPVPYVLEQLTGLRCLQAFIPLSTAEGGDENIGGIMRVSGLHLQCSDAHATVAFTVNGVYHGVRLDAMDCGTRTPEGDSSQIVLTPSQCTATTEVDHILLRVPYSTIGAATAAAASFSNPEDEEFAAATNSAGSAVEGGELYSIGCRFCGSEFVSEGALMKTLAAPTGLLDGTQPRGGDGQGGGWAGGARRSSTRASPDSCWPFTKCSVSYYRSTPTLSPTLTTPTPQIFARMSRARTARSWTFQAARRA